MSNEWKIDVDGVTKDFDTDFGFKVKSWPGTGHSPVANRATPYALQDGAFFTGQRMTARTFTLLGTFYGSTTLAAFHTQRQALIKALSSRTTTINNRPATVTITYTGAAVDKEIYVVYEGGLELATFENNIENDVPIRLTAYDPSWKATSDTVTALGTETTLLARSVWENDGFQWRDILTSSFGSGIRAMAVDSSNGDLYYGGLKVRKWDGTSQTDIASTVTGGNVLAMVYTPTGLLYAAGDFTAINGVAANYIAVWDGVAWSAIGVGADQRIECLAYDVVNGLLYIGGVFTTIGGVAANRIAVYDGATFSALGTGLDAGASALVVDSNADVYVGGQFTTANGVSAIRLAKWTGATFEALGGGANAVVYALAVDSTDLLYIGGLFTSLGGVSVNYVGAWDGSGFSAMGTGLNARVLGFSITTNDTVYAAGFFTADGGAVTTFGHVARYGGSDWVSAGISIPSNSYAIANYEGKIYASTGTYLDTPTTAGLTTIAYAGTEVSYPVFAITRTGGTSLQIVSLINAETGSIIFFNYGLVDGETLTVDLRPGFRSCISSVYGEKWNAILDNSNTASFFLQSGSSTGTNGNNITVAVVDTGSPTITTNMTYRTAYRSLD